jgi:hypothetical protein
MNNASQIKIPLNIINNFVINLYLCRYHKTVQQLILFKQPSANINIEAFSDIFDEKINSILKVLFFLGNFQTTLENFHKVVQRILIHRIDYAKSADNEINHTSSFGDWSILLSSFVDLLTGYFCQLDTLIDLLRGHFSCV